jgi:hypothetical protein
MLMLDIPCQGDFGDMFWSKEAKKFGASDGKAAWSTTAQCGKEEEAVLNGLGMQDSALNGDCRRALPLISGQKTRR